MVHMTPNVLGASWSVCKAVLNDSLTVIVEKGEPRKLVLYSFTRAIWEV